LGFCSNSQYEEEGIAYGELKPHGFWEDWDCILIRLSQLFGAFLG
jgi:hypothetical protein